MKSFDEYLKEDKSNIYPSARQAYKAGVQSQQAKIDELQARIDGALKILDGMRHNGAYRAIDILKGNKDENY